MATLLPEPGAHEQEIADTLRWFEICDDPERLFQWTVNPIATQMTGVIRLHEIAPRRALDALREIAGTKEEWERSFLKPAIEHLESELAGKTNAQALSESARRSIARLTGNAESNDPAAQAKALAAVLTDNATRLGDLELALKLLIPPADPLRYDDASVDEALLTVAKRRDGDVSSLRSRVCVALALHGGGRHWDSIIAPLADAATHHMSPFPEMLPALDWIALREPEPYRTRLSTLVRPNFTRTQGYVDRYLWSAWNADLRELRPEIEGLPLPRPRISKGTSPAGRAIRHPR